MTGASTSDPSAYSMSGSRPRVTSPGRTSAEPTRSGQVAPRAGFGETAMRQQVEAVIASIRYPGGCGLLPSMLPPEQLASSVVEREQATEFALGGLMPVLADLEGLHLADRIRPRTVPFLQGQPDRLG